MDSIILFFEKRLSFRDDKVLRVFLRRVFTSGKVFHLQKMNTLFRMYFPFENDVYECSDCSFGMTGK